MTQQPSKILRLKQVSERTGYKRTSIYEKIKNKQFPNSISLGARAVGWLESEIDAWIASRVQASRGFSDGGTHVK